MATERTFAIIKPDAVRKKVAGQIINRIEEAGLEIVAMKCGVKHPLIHGMAHLVGQFLGQHPCQGSPTGGNPQQQQLTAVSHPFQHLRTKANQGALQLARIENGALLTRFGRQGRAIHGLNICDDDRI